MKKNNHPSFSRKGEFTKTLTERVEDYFKSNNLSKKGNLTLYTKAALIITLWALFYFLAFTRDNPWWLQVLYGGTLGFLTTSIGFNIGHDALHGAFSKNEKVNQLLGHSFDIAGVSSFIWKTKHNIIHHTWTNVLGDDDDIEARPLLRLHEGQPHARIHRYQHRYFLGAYALLFVYWVLVTDAKKIFKRNINGHTIVVSRKDFIAFLFWKCVFIGIWIVLPISLVGVVGWLWCFVPLALVCGAYMSIIFQLAHIVDTTEQPNPIPNVLLEEFTIFQVKTTANFAPRSRFWNYWTGGLNHQVEHHLFHSIAHIHYEALAPIVRKTCEEYSVPYNEYPTFKTAYQAHVRCLKRLSFPS